VAKLTLGKVGVTVNVSDDNTYLEDAAELERLGYSAVWLPGGELDTLERVVDLVAATQKIPVGTAIIPPDVYGADTVATTFDRIERMSPGRFVVGLGTPHQQQPVRQLTSYLDHLDTALPPVPAQQRILGAVGPRMLELAATRAAGTVPLLVTPGYTAWARKILGDDASLIIYQLVVGDTNPHSARQTACEPTLRGLLSGGGNPHAMRQMGFTHNDAINLNDHVVDELVAWGHEHTIVSRISEHLAAGADHVILGVLHNGHPSSVENPVELARQLARPLADELGTN